MKRHPFHLVELSPWPMMAGFMALSLTLSLVLWMHSSYFMPLTLSLISIMAIMFVWWRDISREGSMQGFHTNIVVYGLRVGMILFITSEVLFFFGFFWGYFHSSLVPTNELGCVWPPVGILAINAFSVPMLNTVILLSSGVTVTLAHHSMLKGNYKLSTYALLMTILLGLYFTYMQAGEYYLAPFNISDSIYGTTFFVTTGFHGAHVMIGTIFLMICLLRLLYKQFSSNHHFGFEAAAWYWHFVDVVWICLFIIMYWWGS
uniref:Cytochrome c oxidase subunit 3 n=1 Tax=Pterobdella arugamensis TaxID=3410361 RepID=A0A343B6W3_9ANNE|nr:cytochrome c oxidase subunit 3 [Zeylanicobdella arugamensis]AQT26246.1 cytochrome c oxidase subunit 3 [Zeylanicobdella arugamensis]